MNLEPVQVFIHTPESNGSVLIKACDQAEKQSELPVKRSPPQPIYAGSGPLPSLLQGLIEIIVSNTNQIDGGAREAVGRLARTLGQRLPVTALKALGGYVGEKLGDVATQAVAEAWSDANAAISPANELVGQIKDVIVRADGQTLLELCELTVDSLSPVRLLLPLKGGHGSAVTTMVSSCWLRSLREPWRKNCPAQCLSTSAVMNRTSKTFFSSSRSKWVRMRWRSRLQIARRW